ncbi:MAG TPA: hypothetical protein VIK08_06060 [Candidatus Limnocylindrales bacterium]
MLGRERHAGAITNVESIGSEAGRNVFGNYLLMPPGTSTLGYRWATRGVATQAGGAWTYDSRSRNNRGSGPHLSR